MKLIRSASRIVLGTVFIFSGVVKAIDPLGSAYKFHDYFQAFHIGFLDTLSLALSILLCSAEFLAGFSVLTGLRQKYGIVLVLILMLIFTPITLVLALTNPVSDCGCFGDAIHLTNWQTFGKNIILIVPAIFLFIQRKQITSLFRPLTELMILLITLVIFILFSLYNLKYLPVVDFLPYKTGVKIAEKMVIPEGARPDEYSTTFVYERNGEKKEFTLDNYPANDTTWKFVDQKSVLVRKGYEPPIHDFIITTTEGEDITQRILSHPGYTLLMISRKLADAKSKLLTEGFNLGRECSENGIDFYILSASGTDELRAYLNGLKFCSVDETTLKTMVRSNPGYLLLKNGTIIGKWSWANVPGKGWFDKLLTESN
jgi:hypothetical protein